MFVASERDLDRNAAVSNESDCNEPTCVPGGVSCVAGGCPRSTVNNKKQGRYVMYFFELVFYCEAFTLNS